MLKLFAREKRVCLVDFSFHLIFIYDDVEHISREFDVNVKVVNKFIKSGRKFRGGYKLVKKYQLEKLRRKWLANRDKYISNKKKQLEYDFPYDKVKVKMLMNEFLLNL